MTTTSTTTVTAEQIARCHRVIDLNNNLPFYMVESESGNGQEYKFSTIRKNGQWHIVCTCPAGLKGIPCKHRKWAKAAAEEFKAELAEQARNDAYKIERERLYKELNTGYASPSVTNEDLARIIERNKKPARIVERKGYEARPFSLLK